MQRIWVTSGVIPVGEDKHVTATWCHAGSDGKLAPVLPHSEPVSGHFLRFDRSTEHGVPPIPSQLSVRYNSTEYAT